MIKSLCQNFMKIKAGKVMGICMLVCCILFFLPENIEAKTIVGYQNEYADKSGRYIYYSAPQNSLMRYDIKTGKIKEVYSCKVYNEYSKQKELSNGFSSVTVKGKNIYVQWSISRGTSGPELGKSYIYRISNDGKKAKKLAMGANPVIIGKRVYYDEVKKVYKYDDWWYEQTGKKMSMKLNGKNKRYEKVLVKIKKRKIRNYKFKIKDYPYPDYAKDEKGNSYNKALLLIDSNGKEVELAKWWWS